MKNALKKYRKAEEEDVDAAIADFEEGVEHRGIIMNGTCSQSQLRA